MAFAPIEDEWRQLVDLYNAVRCWSLTDAQKAQIAQQLMERWLRNKGWMAEYLGPEYCLSKDISLDKPSPDAVSYVIEQALHNLENAGIYTRKTHEFLRGELMKGSKGEFAYEKVLEGVTSSGTKLGKFLLSYAPKYKLESDNKYIQDKVADIWGTYCQQLKLSGNLIVSARPFDIVLMSEHGIRSCMGINKDYPWGSLACALDSTSTVAAMVDTVDPPSNVMPHNTTIYSDFALPKKAWRQMIYLAQSFKDEQRPKSPRLNVVWQSRHYPNTNAYAATTAKEMILATVQGGTITPVRDLYYAPGVSAHFSRMYLDAPTAVTYIDYFDGERRMNSRVNNVIVGTDIPCFGCGILLDGGAVCRDCKYDARFQPRPTAAVPDPVPAGGNVGRPGNVDGDMDDDNQVECISCGEMIDRDDAYIGPDEQYYCQNCYEDTFSTCDRCGNVVESNDMTMVYVGDQEQSWCPNCVENHTYTCGHCEETISEESDPSVPVAVFFTYNSQDHITSRMMTSYYCPSCAADESFTCVDCGDHFKVERSIEDTGYEVENENGDDECPACRVRRLGTMIAPVNEDEV